MKHTCVLLFLLLALSARAQAEPVDGWYWNPNESGRGLNIEIQDNTLFIAFFHYDASGAPVWWVASGDYEAGTGRVTGEFYRTSDGQCPGCVPRTPNVDFDFDGDFELVFDTRISATLNWAGGSTPLVRQYWAFDLGDPLGFMYGDFHFTSGELGIYFGERLRFDEEYIGDDGARYLAGGIIGGSASRMALVNYTSDLGYLILLDSAPSFYTAYSFDMSKDRLVGRSWTYRKEESLSGSGLSSIGHRTASKTAVTGGSGGQLMAKPNNETDMAVIRALTQDARWMLSARSNEPASQTEFEAETEYASVSEQLRDMEQILGGISPEPADNRQ